MDVLVIPSKISGEVYAPPSKSYAHRYIISAFLSGGEGFIENIGDSKDVLATLGALFPVGLNYKCENNGVYISKKPIEENPILNCNESGSTLRFLFPVMCALGIKCTFTGKGRLLSRPIVELSNCLNKNGAKIDGFSINGKLQSGEFTIKGDISSQFISGLLFALPLLDGDSKIVIEGQVVSEDYINITLEVLDKFGIEISKKEYGYFVKGNQRYKMPNKNIIEGDYSGASFLLSMGVLSEGVKVLNLNKATSQGDKKIVEVLRKFGGIVEELDNGYFAKKGTLTGITLDCENIPDLVQIISVVAAYSKGATKLLNVSRLKIKESDRIAGIINNLSRANVKAEFNGKDLIISGGEPIGATFSGDNDHRTVMSSVVLASFANGNSNILGAEAVDKSYKNFFNDYMTLGGKINGSF